MTIYAIKKDNKILTHTIAEWQRAAVVAYLLENAHQRVFCNDTDATIDKLWSGYADGAKLIEVVVEEKKQESVVVKIVRPFNYDEDKQEGPWEPNFVPLQGENIIETTDTK